jgi:hypothetical protein
MENELTQGELAFLARQGLGPGDVYDARGLPQSYWRKDMKDEGKTIALGNPCKKGGHRLRSRGGHCSQCDTSVVTRERVSQLFVRRGLPQGVFETMPE